MQQKLENLPYSLTYITLYKTYSQILPKSNFNKKVFVIINKSGEMYVPEKPAFPINNPFLLEIEIKNGKEGKWDIEVLYYLQIEPQKL